MKFLLYGLLLSPLGVAFIWVVVAAANTDWALLVVLGAVFGVFGWEWVITRLEHRQMRRMYRSYR